MTTLIRLPNSLKNLAIKKGFLYTLLMWLITSIILEIIDNVDAARHSGYERYDTVVFIVWFSENLLQSVFLLFLFGTLLIAIPTFYASSILVRQLYADHTMNSLTIKTGKIKGLLIGAAFGLSITFFMTLIIISVTSLSEFISFLREPVINLEIIYLKAFFYVPPLFGAAAGHQLGKYLSKYLTLNNIV